jgi:hypothetical protein
MAFFIKIEAHDIPKHLLLILLSSQFEYLLKLLSTDSPAQTSLQHAIVRINPLRSIMDVMLRLSGRARCAGDGSPSRHHAITGCESRTQQLGSPAPWQLGDYPLGGMSMLRAEITTRRSMMILGTEARVPCLFLSHRSLHKSQECWAAARLDDDR